VESFIDIGSRIACLFLTLRRKEECMKLFNSLFTIILLSPATTSPALADILILKTGGRVTGSFDGGNGRVVRFRTAYGDVKEYDILNVQQIQFVDEQKTTVLPTTSASQLNAANMGFILRPVRKSRFE
jgi:hypothetical protein